MQEVLKREKSKYLLTNKEFLKGDWLKNIKINDDDVLDVIFTRETLTIVKFKKGSDSNE